MFIERSVHDSWEHGVEEMKEKEGFIELESGPISFDWKSNLWQKDRDHKCTGGLGSRWKAPGQKNENTDKEMHERRCKIRY